MDEDEEAEYRARVRAARSRGDGRSAVIAGASVAPDADFEAPVIDKTAEEHAEISGAMASNFIFSGLDEDQRGVLVGAMERRAFSAGETIIRQGDDGDYFYLQASGTCHVLVDGQLVLTTTAGKSFGELALIHSAPRAASVVVAEDSEPVTAWAIGGDVFKHVVMSMTEEKRRRHAEAINRVPLLHGLTDTDRAAVMDCLLPVSVAAGGVVIAEGEDAPDRFYIVERGELKVVSPLPVHAWLCWQYTRADPVVCRSSVSW
jgi:cAMP-dependent protein kinase regulator